MYIHSSISKSFITHSAIVQFFGKIIENYYNTRMKNHLKMNKEIGMMLPKKELIQVE